MLVFPNTIAPFVDKAGRILAPFLQYLQQFTIAPPAIMDITVLASPFAYTAKEPGNVYITGGTVSAIHLLRGSVDLNVTGQTLIPVAIKDVVAIIYTVLPTIKFIPSYGQNTNQ